MSKTKAQTELRDRIGNLEAGMADRNGRITRLHAERDELTAQRDEYAAQLAAVEANLKSYSDQLVSAEVRARSAESRADYWETRCREAERPWWRVVKMKRQSKLISRPISFMLPDEMTTLKPQPIPERRSFAAFAKTPQNQMNKLSFITARVYRLGNDAPVVLRRAFLDQSMHTIYFYTLYNTRKNK